MWMNYWSFARYHLKLTDQEFYELTPRQFTALLERHRVEEERQEFLMGILGSTFVNYSLGCPKEPAKPEDFMPSQWAKKIEAQAKPKRKRIPKAVRQRVANSTRGIFSGLIARQEQLAVEGRVEGVVLPDSSKE